MRYIETEPLEVVSEVRLLRQISGIRALLPASQTFQDGGIEDPVLLVCIIDKRAGVTVPIQRNTGDGYGPHHFWRDLDHARYARPLRCVTARRLYRERN